MPSFKQKLKAFLPTPVWNFFGLLLHPSRLRRGRTSYAQEGEDIALFSLFQRLGISGPGFYVDIGAHHPKRLSNTYFFYRRGWYGINVDAMPGSMKPFNRIRRRDINLEMGISSERQTLTYHIFNEPALNGFSKEMSNDRDGAGPYRILKKIDVPTIPLRDVLEEHVPQGCRIDFMSVDVEGLDLPVLQSNDWNKFRPTVILAESLSAMAQTVENDPVAKFLHDRGYVPIVVTGRTAFYVQQTEVRKLQAGRDA